MHARFTSPHTMSSRVQITVENNIATVRLNRPEKRNAVDWPMLEAWIDTPKKLRKDRNLRGVVLLGNGPSFCAGLDFPSFTTQPTKAMRAFMQPGEHGTNLFQQACMGWRDLPVPVIAVIHGHCFGAGIQLALAADFRFAHPDAQLSILEAKWGLIPDMSGTVTIRELIPQDLAKRLTMTGEVFSAQQAKAWNLLSEVSQDPETAARALLEQIVDRSPDSVAAAKALWQQTWTADEEDALALERRWQRRLLAGKNQRIAMKRNFKNETLAFKPRSIKSL